MKLKRMGLAVCLLGAASVANADYTWSNCQDSSSVEKVKKVNVEASVTGYTGSNLHRKNDPKAPTVSTRGYTWSNLDGKSHSKAPTASPHGYLWSN